MFGFRPDGRQVRGIDPIQRIIPHIMPQRHDSQNMTHYDCKCLPMDTFIKEQAEAGEQFNYMHILIAALVRLIAMNPRLNRFVMNGRIFARNNIFISFVVKKRLSITVPDTTVKLEFTGHESIYEVRDKINEAIVKNATEKANNGTDKLARVLTHTPNFVLKFLVGTIKFLDKHGLLPMSIIRVSPFHTSCFVTNLKSIKGPSIFHHLYDFGNTGLFFAMGKESLTPVEKSKQHDLAKIMPVDIVMDERFCDGFYYVRALGYFRKLMEHPEMLKEREENLPEDLEVIDPYSRKARRAAKAAAKAAASEEDPEEEGDN